MRSVAIWVALLASCASAFGEESALGQLRAAGAVSAAQAVPAPLASPTGKPCERGNYKGTCFYSTGGEIVYWILREWTAAGPVGKGIIGYPMVAKKQAEYNQWAVLVKADRARFPSVVTTDDLAKAGWADGIFYVPEHLLDVGRVDAPTLRIPFFRSWARLLAVWSRFETDCARSSYFAACSTEIGDLEIDGIREDSLDAERLKTRAKWIVAARDDLRRFDAAFAEIPSDLERPDEAPAGLISRLSVIAADVETDLVAVESTERLYR